MTENQKDNPKIVRMPLMVVLLLLCAIYTPIFIGQILARAEVIRKSKWVIDSNSPVYQYARKISGGGHNYLEHCDNVPSVKVGQQDGYRILLEKLWWKYHHKNGTKSVTMFHCYMDIVLVPVDESFTPVVGDIAWEKFRQDRSVESVYMGRGNGYHWFGRMPIPDQERIRTLQSLTGGDDRLELLVNYLNRAKGRDRSNRLTLLVDVMGDRSLPVLEKEIKRATLDSMEILCSIPGEGSTKLILAFYEEPKYRSEIQRSITLRSRFNRKSEMYIRPSAKRIYLDALDAYSLSLSSYDLTDSRGYYPSPLTQVLKVAFEYKWKEVIPILEKIEKNPYTLDQYIEVKNAIRVLNGNPVSEEILDAKETLIKYFGYESVSLEEFRDAREFLLNHEDHESMILVGIYLAGFTESWGMGGRREIPELNYFGYEMIQNLPRGVVFPVLDHLANNIQYEYSKSEVIKIQKTLNTYIDDLELWQAETDRIQEMLMERRASDLLREQRRSQGNI